ncbi:AzlC family ABC transporter permease [Kitasatospora indigofera]|uniref:AzlC family ABC transporter permease n=1 Tax=Kitasatospora indigofera TaxID=67307 RepID=UPI0036254904
MSVEQDLPAVGEAPVGTAPARKATAAVVRDSLGIGLTVGVSGLAFGIAGSAAHLSVWQTCALSLLVFTGASQFALVSALAAGAALPAAVLGALFLGARNAFYGLRLGPRLELSRLTRPFAAHLMIDETAAVALTQPDRRAARLGFAVTGISLFATWNLCTLAGALGADALGDPAVYGLDAAGPAVFLALLAPRLREGATELKVAAVGAVLALAATVVLPTGVPVLLSIAAVPIVLAAGRTREGDAGDGPDGPDGDGLATTAGRAGKEDLG